MSKPLTMTVEKEREYRACCTSGGTEVDPVFAELDATRAALAAAESKLSEMACELDGWKHGFKCNFCVEDVCEAIAQAREEGRAEEREACALWHDDRAKHFARFNDEDAVRRHGIYATAIRARGNATLPAADAASEV